VLRAANIDIGDDMPVMKPVRLSLELSLQCNERLELLASKLCATKSEVLRRAVTLYAECLKAKEEGLHVGIADKGQSLMKEFIGLEG